MRRILFYAQNNGQVEDVRLMLDEFHRNNFEVSIYDTTEIYHQPIDLSGFSHIVKGDFSLERSFYRLPLAKRINSIWRGRIILRSMANQFDMLIVACDGAFERILINSFRKQDKKTILIIDGIISEYSITLTDLLKHPSEIVNVLKSKLSDIFKLYVYNALKTSAISPYLPSKIGMMPLDKILVMGEHSKKCIEKINKKSAVIASGLPRLYGKKIVKQNAEDSNVVYVCYFPSAFKWHHLMEEDQCQHSDISNVCNIIDEIRNKTKKDVRFVIKMHPRESPEDYQRYLLKYNFVSLIDNKSIIESFETYSLFLSNVSTVIVEGLINNIKVYSLMIHFQYWKYKNSFLSSDSIKKIYSFDDLYNLILSCANGENCYTIDESQDCDLFERNCSPIEVVKKIVD